MSAQKTEEQLNNTKGLYLKVKLDQAATVTDQSSTR